MVGSLKENLEQIKSNIAGELFEVKTRYDESVSKIKELEEKIVSLSQKIDTVL